MTRIWKKKGFMAFLAVTMLVSLTVGCSNNTNKPTASEKSTTQESTLKETATPVPTKAGVKYPTAISYFTSMDGDAAVSLKSYSEMGLYKQLEKITGTKVTFQHPTAGAEGNDQFNLMLASGKLPDVMYYPWKGKAPDKLIKDGRILRLNELIEKYAPNLTKILNDKPDLKKQLTSDEGNIYVFPLIPAPSQFAYHGVMLRKDWLDKLNLQPPVTIDDWEKVLTAFRDKDPNGNGKKDEIPYFYSPDDYQQSYPFLGAFGISAGFYQENNVVKFGPVQPQFKDYLTLMNTWYKAGLIDKDYLTSNTKIRDSKMLNDTIGAMAGWAGSNLGSFMQLKKDKDPNFKLIGVPFPALKAGVLAVSDGSPVSQWGGVGVAISASAKNPEEIAAWLDYAYSKEGSLLYNFGIEGESYTMVNGKPQYTDLILKNPNKLSVSQALSMYTIETSGGPFPVDADADLQWHNNPETMGAMRAWGAADHSKYMPYNPNSAEQATIGSIMTDLNTYMNEMINKFIMGQEPLTKFDEYLKTLTKLKVEEVVKTYQASLDRYLKK